MQKEKTYSAAFVTSQGVPEKLGQNRQDMAANAVEAMVLYLIKNPNFNFKSCNTFSMV